MNAIKGVIAVAAWTVVAAVAQHADADRATFTGIGFLPQSPKRSYAWAVSGDGSTVAGSAAGSVGNSEAVQWTLQTGLLSLGGSSGPPVSSLALGISGDGRIVVGADLPEGSHSLRWVLGSGAQVLPGRAAFAASWDGSVIVGNTRTPDGDLAYRWSEATGLVELGNVNGGPPGNCGANGVSADGLVVAGYSELPISAGGITAVRWTLHEGVVSLDRLSIGTNWSVANAVSADGQVIVGHSQSGTAFEAFRWTLAGGMQGLGDLPGEPFDSRALAVSADGSVIVGTSEPEAFIWTAGGGMRSLRDELTTRYGLDLTGWTLGHAHGISADGRTIVGEGRNPCGQDEGWIARLGADAPCGADFNLDGRLTVQNLFDFLAGYFGGVCSANFNQVSGFTVQDIFDFLAAYFGGCP